MSLLILDDSFLSELEIKEIEKRFYSIPAIFSKFTNYVSEYNLPKSTDTYSNRFMYASAYGEQNFTDGLSLEILNKFCNKHGIKYGTVERTRSNTTFACKEMRPSIPHVDDYSDHLVLLYYVNDSDGDTVLYKNEYNEVENNEMIVETRVSPKAGRAILFEGSTYHSFYYPNMHDTRSVININISKDEE